MKTEQIQSYNNFLKSKLIKTDYYGIDTNENELNPKLFDFQKKIVKWALKKGKSAIFADTGLGKTPMQLEWSNQIWKSLTLMLILQIIRKKL